MELKWNKREWWHDYLELYNLLQQSAERAYHMHQLYTKAFASVTDSQALAVAAPIGGIPFGWNETDRICIVFDWKKFTFVCDLCCLRYHYIMCRHNHYLSCRTELSVCLMSACVCAHVGINVRRRCTIVRGLCHVRIHHNDYANNTPDIIFILFTHTYWRAQEPLDWNAYTDTKWVYAPVSCQRQNVFMCRCNDNDAEKHWCGVAW